jgi:hypothetical protein
MSDMGKFEERQAIAKTGPAVTLSPARRRVARIGCVIAIAAAFGLLISRTIDMYQIDHFTLLALYNANANFSGLINVLTIVCFGFAFLRYRPDGQA